MLPHVQQINIFDSEKEVEYHSHSICEIIYLLRGQCDITIKGQSFCMTAGDVMVIAPGEVHNQICNGRVKNYFIIFSAGEAEFSCHTRLLHCGLNPLFLRFFRMLLLLPEADGIFYSLLQQLNFLEKQSLRLLDIHPGLRRAVAFCEKNYTEPLSIEYIAAQSSVSPELLYILFRRQYDITPQKYLNNLRLKRAAVLLRDKSKNIKDIAIECGLHNNSHFSALFKRHFGCTPSRFRLQLEQTEIEVES